MPYQITFEKQGLLVRWWGQATTAELIHVQEQAHVHAAFETFHHAIHDFRECEHFVYVQSDIEYSAALDRAASMTNENIRIAIVGANDAVAKAARAYLSTSLSPYPVRFFTTMDEARAWLTPL